MQKILSFYSKIFEHELSKSKRLHLQSNKIAKKLFISGAEELINGDHPLIPLSDSKAESFIKEIELNGKDLELAYFSLARITRFTSFGTYEVTRVYPLLKYKAELILKDGNYYITLDLDSKTLLESNFKSNHKNPIDFKKLKSKPLVDFHFVSQLADKLNGTENVLTDDLRLFPKLWSARKVNAKTKVSILEKDIYIPCSVLCLVEKPKFSFSTLNELKLLSKAKSFSAPLQVIFKYRNNKDIENEGIICEELNFWQQQAIENSNSKIVSIISGPPGTGKSFTIANLAAEKVSKGQTVLISSKNNEALEVIASKIKDNLGIDNLTINPSKQNNLSDLKHHLKYILGRSYQSKDISFNRIAKDKIMVKANIKKLKTFEKLVEKTFELEKKILLNLNTNSFTKESSDLFKKRILKARGLKTIPLWLKLEEYYTLIEQNRKFSIKAIQRANTYKLEQSVIHHSKHLRDYLNFLRARDPKRKQKLYKDLNHTIILKTFPVWLVKASKIANVFPRNKEMFDFLIIDEASQCDIPSIIPLLQRAKKCIVVGDENQLGHISFVSKIIERTLKEKIPENQHHLCYHRDYSLLSLVNDNCDPKDISYLSEHFRSRHAIIEFSNQVIYNNQLEILTKRPSKNDNAVEFIDARGINTKSVNLVEVDLIINKVKEKIEQECDLPSQLKTTMGLLSPFRNQVDKLFFAVKKEFTLAQIRDHKIMVGTAFSFQGNERDMMLLSLVVDDKSHAGSFNYINRKDVFNVSVTRARNKQLVYYSFNPKKLKFESTLELFFGFYEKYTTHFIEEFNKNKFCEEIENYIQKFGFKTWQQFEVSGVKIDVLAQKNGQFIAIDLVGFPGEVGDFYKLERYKMLERGKIKLFPLPYAYWLFDKPFCLKAIEKLCVHI